MMNLFSEICGLAGSKGCGKELKRLNEVIAS